MNHAACGMPAQCMGSLSCLHHACLRTCGWDVKCRQDALPDRAAHQSWRLGAGDAGDAAMAAAFDEVIGPAADRFQPDIILVRAALLMATEVHG